MLFGCRRDADILHIFKIHSQMVGEDPLQFKWLRQDEAFHTYVGRTRLLSSRSFYVASKVKVFFSPVSSVISKVEMCLLSALLVVSVEVVNCND